MNHLRAYSLWLLSLLLLLVVLAVAPLHAARPVMPSGEATYQKWTYPIPVQPDTQSGQAFLDAQGRVFSVVRDDARLQVFQGSERVVNEPDGYGAPDGYVNPADGCLYVSALEAAQPRDLWIFVRVPGFDCHNFITGRAGLGLVRVP